MVLVYFSNPNMIYQRKKSTLLNGKCKIENEVLVMQQDKSWKWFLAKLGPRRDMIEPRTLKLEVIKIQVVTIILQI